MRPLRLQWQAFGSYPGSVTVDFTSLASRGLFVVTGPTGSGKTTIFDAMCFALYGSMPLKEGGEARSHHAALEDPTWVRFGFALGNEEYLVERSPEQTRPARRGGGTVVQGATATLTRLDGDGASEVLATGTRQTSTTILDLLGLDQNQFQRVMLLPQGEVSRFLLDSSADREKLLATLFGGEVYDRVVERLATEERHLESQVAATDEEARHHLRTARSSIIELERDLTAIGREGSEPSSEVDLVADPAEDSHPTTPDGSDSDDVDELDSDALRHRLVATEASQTALTARALAARERTETLQAAHSAAEQAAERFGRAARLRGEFDELDLTQSEVDESERVALASQRARPVAIAAETARRCEQEHHHATQALENRREELRRMANDAGIELDVTSGISVTRDLHRIRLDLMRDRSLLDAVTATSEDLDTKIGLHQTASEELTRSEDESRRLSSELAALIERTAELEAQPRDVDAAHAEVDRLERALVDLARSTTVAKDLAALETALATAQADEKELWNRFVATQAPRLAASLLESEPCPVCGSCEHPDPARADDDRMVSFDEVDEARRATQRTRERAEEQRRALADLTRELAELASLDETEITELLEHARMRVTETVANVSALERHRVSVTDAQGALEAARTRTVVAGERVTTALGAQVEAETKAEQARTAAAHLDADVVTSALAVVDTLDALSAELAEMVDAVVQTEQRSRSAHEQAETALAAAELDTVDRAYEALVDPDVEQRALATAHDRRERRREIGIELSALIAQGLPDEQPDLEMSRHAAAEAASIAEELTILNARIQDRATTAHRALTDHDAVTAGTKALRDRYDAARRAHRVCQGRNAQGLSLRRWVLAQELDRVVAVASSHLHAMSAGRYGLRRLAGRRDGRQAAGLDLEVLDSHTGRPRSPSSLSGGEQFQASLALALGLADVVSLGGTASGHRFEALFVDEGFGALDPDALDDAIDTLHQLQAAGRMVGAITHVEAMKERLPVGIEVRRLPDGRGSTLVVNP